jgi:hypothetical protein
MRTEQARAGAANPTGCPGPGANVSSLCGGRRISNLSSRPPRGCRGRPEVQVPYSPVLGRIVTTPRWTEEEGDGVVNRAAVAATNLAPSRQQRSVPQEATDGPVSQLGLLLCLCAVLEPLCAPVTQLVEHRK